MITDHYYYEIEVTAKNRKKPKKVKECCFVKTEFNEEYANENKRRFDYASEYKRAINDLIYRDEFSESPIELVLSELPLWFLKEYA
jgi:hypothetical protein